MEDIYVIGVGMTPFGRLLDLDMKTLSRMAVEGGGLRGPRLGAGRTR